MTQAVILLKYFPYHVNGFWLATEAIGCLESQQQAHLKVQDESEGGLFLAAPHVRILTPLALTADSTLISASNQLMSDGTDEGYSGFMNVRRARLINPPAKCLDLTEFVKVQSGASQPLRMICFLINLSSEKHFES